MGWPASCQIQNRLDVVGDASQSSDRERGYALSDACGIMEAEVGSGTAKRREEDGKQALPDA